MKLYQSYPSFFEYFFPTLNLIKTKYFTLLAIYHVSLAFTTMINDIRVVMQN